ncbi:MAG: LLM class flavin-dependent oxidoreductase [Proteobacteria bacterium]|nr:LLM class flavin-dependent oxidoreductase [Pseudomonadota bacterium]
MLPLTFRGIARASTLGHHPGMNTHHGRARRLGLMLWPAPGLGAGFERGRWAASHGYDDLWLADAEGLEDPLTLAAALGVTCDKVRLATGIVPVFNRPPALLATAVVAAEARAPGRLVLGLGASTPNMIERWYGLPYAKPLTRVRETIALLRQILNGEKTAFDGATLRSHGFQLKSLPTQPVPIVLGAIGGKMLELAGEVADGVLLNDFTPPDRLAYALERLDVGAKRGGRRVEDLEIIKRRALYLGDEGAGGMEYFRQHLAFYASAAQYQNVMIELGYGHAVEEARAGYATRSAPHHRRHQRRHRRAHLQLRQRGALPRVGGGRLRGRRRHRHHQSPRWHHGEFRARRRGLPAIGVRSARARVIPQAGFGEG